jgi:ribonuclease VapC
VIVDTSALVAIINLELDGPLYEAAIEASRINRISAATYLEVSIVIDRSRDPMVSRRVDDILSVGEFVIEPVTATQARIAREAYRDFGKGSGHRAGLNYGDCFAYALARERDEPLLFKGDDFRHTDIRFVGEPAERRRLHELWTRYGADPLSE